eukprot:TRINITY_DN2406_c3_g1_i1.p1 TRINITY_DN2406_c3_g1~~TRINITY_DN2406_c3_g1_i1.p1  ORF type:complete len:2105 (+),score=556.74 TRINITY_DN2406_c3_g1_i1:80-6394(+)
MSAAVTPSSERECVAGAVTEHVKEGMDEWKKRAKDRASLHGKKVWDRWEASGLMWKAWLHNDEMDKPIEDRDEENLSEESWIQLKKHNLEKRIQDIRMESNKVAAHCIVQLLPEEDVPFVRQQMRQGLECSEFVDVLEEVILRHPDFASSGQTEEDLREALVGLFLGIDVNGNGTVDWEEFTHYLVNSYQVRKEQASNQLPWAELHRYAAASERCKRRKIYYFSDPDRIVTLDTHHLGNEDSARLSVYIPQPAPQVTQHYATHKHDYSYEAAEWVPEYRQLVVSAANNMLRWFELKDPKDTRRVDRIQFVKHNYVDGRQMQLRWDAESGVLFSGNNEGGLLGIRPDSSVYDTPTVVYGARGSVRPHMEEGGTAHPVVDVLPLPSVGSKKVVSCGLDSRCFINDVETGKPLLELGRHGEDGHAQHKGITNLTYSAEFALLGTSGWHDPEPTLWTPLAGQCISRLQDIENPHKGRVVGVWCMEQSPAPVSEKVAATRPLRTHHLISADSLGMFKVWDIRKASVLQTFYLDPSIGDLNTRLALQDSKMARVSGDDGKTEEEGDQYHQRITLFDFAVDCRRGWVLSAGRTDTEKVMHCLKQETAKHRNGYVAHDTPVTAVIYNGVTRCFLTASGVDVRVWDAATGTVKADYRGVGPTTITAVSVDEAGRRFAMGCHCGSLSVLSFATGAELMQYNAVPGEITGLSHVTEQEMIVALSQLGHLVCYSSADDAPPRPLLALWDRQHQTPLLAVTRAPSLSVFITGSAAESIVVHDTNSLTRGKILARCTPPGGQVVRLADDSPIGGDDQWGTDQHIDMMMHPERNEICALRVLEPYPALIAADFGGNLAFWTLRPYGKPYRCATRWRAFRAKTSAVVPVVTAMKSIGTTLYCGDDQGYVSAWDITVVKDALLMRPSRFPSQDYYLGKDAAGVAVVELSGVQPKLQTCFVAHKSGKPVRCMEIIADKGVLVTGGGDCNVFLWSLEGDRIGKFEQARELRPGAELSIPADYAGAAAALGKAESQPCTRANTEAAELQLPLEVADPPEATPAAETEEPAAPPQPDESVSERASNPTPQKSQRPPQAVAITDKEWARLQPSDGVWTGRGDTADEASVERKRGKGHGFGAGTIKDMVAAAEAIIQVAQDDFHRDYASEYEHATAGSPAPAPTPPVSPSRVLEIRSRYVAMPTSGPFSPRSPAPRKGSRPEPVRAKRPGEVQTRDPDGPSPTDELLAAVRQQLTSLWKEVGPPPGSSLIFTRPKMTSHDAPSVALAFASAPSSQTDWQCRARAIEPSERSHVLSLVANFRRHQITAPHPQIQRAWLMRPPVPQSVPPAPITPDTKTRHRPPAIEAPNWYHLSGEAPGELTSPDLRSPVHVDRRESAGCIDTLEIQRVASRRSIFDVDPQLSDGESFRSSIPGHDAQGAEGADPVNMFLSGDKLPADADENTLMAAASIILSSQTPTTARQLAKQKSDARLSTAPQKSFRVKQRLAAKAEEPQEGHGTRVGAPPTVRRKASAVAEMISEQLSPSSRKAPEVQSPTRSPTLMLKSPRKSRTSRAGSGFFRSSPRHSNAYFFRATDFAEERSPRSGSDGLHIDALLGSVADRPAQQPVSPGPCTEGGVWSWSASVVQSRPKESSRGPSPVQERSHTFGGTPGTHDRHQMYSQLLPARTYEPPLPPRSPLYVPGLQVPAPAPSSFHRPCATAAAEAAAAAAVLVVASAPRGTDAFIFSLLSPPRSPARVHSPPIHRRPASLRPLTAERPLYRPPMSKLNPMYVVASAVSSSVSEIPLDRVPRADMGKGPTHPTQQATRVARPDLEPMLCEEAPNARFEPLTSPERLARWQLRQHEQQQQSFRQETASESAIAVKSSDVSVVSATPPNPLQPRTTVLEKLVDKYGPNGMPPAVKQLAMRLSMAGVERAQHRQEALALDVIVYRRPGSAPPPGLASSATPASDAVRLVGTPDLLPRKPPPGGGSRRRILDDIAKHRALLAAQQRPQSAGDAEVPQTPATPPPPRPASAAPAPKSPDVSSLLRRRPTVTVVRSPESSTRDAQKEWDRNELLGAVRQRPFPSGCIPSAAAVGDSGGFRERAGRRRQRWTRPGRPEQHMAAPVVG